MFENPILMTISATALLASPVASVLTSVRTYQSGEHPTAAMPIDEYEKKKTVILGVCVLRTGCVLRNLCSGIVHFVSRIIVCANPTATYQQYYWCILCTTTVEEEIRRYDGSHLQRISCRFIGACRISHARCARHEWTLVDNTQTNTMTPRVT